MSQTLSLQNYLSSNVVQQTRLGGTVIPPASAALTVENNSGFTAGDYFALGTLGGEVTELLTVGSTTGQTTITPTASTTLNHSGYDYVTKLFGNQLKIYRAPNVNGLQPDDTSFSVVTTVNLDVDQAFTEYTDSSGGSTYWYKYTYYNSTTTSETNLGDSLAVRGGGVGNYCSIEAIRTEAGFTNAPYVTDQMIDKKRQAAQRDLVLPMTQLTLTATTTETSLIGAVASTFNDILSLVVINTSATATQVDFRDSTAGTIRLSLYVPAGDTRGISLTTPMPQAAVNTAWTAKCGTSVSSVIITGTYISNK